MAVYTIYQILLFALPFLFIIVGAALKIPVLVVLAGMGLVVLPFTMAFPMWLLLLFVFLGLMFFIGGMFQGWRTKA